MILVMIFMQQGAYLCFFGRSPSPCVRRESSFVWISFLFPFFLSPFLSNLFRCTQLIPMRATKAYHKLAPLENERK